MPDFHESPALGIAQCVWKWARLTPEAIALTDGARQVTYRELARRADELTARLAAARVGPEVLVALCGEPSTDLIAGMVAILATGGAYLPIDPSYPPERLRYLLENSRCLVALVDRTHATLFAEYPGVVLPLDQGAPNPGRFQAASIPPDGDRLAYVIYTSGSTGKPNGVEITQRNLARLFEQTEHWFRFGRDDVWTLFHSISFDFSIWEIWGALRHGGRLVIVPHDVRRDPVAFRALVRAEQVTVLSQTPSAFRLFLRADALLRPPSADALRHVILAGEALDPRWLRPWFDRHGDSAPRLVNMYGPTEATVFATYRPLTHQGAETSDCSIGVPLPDVTIRLLDADGRPAREGDQGEIWIGGPGVARGYWRNADLTAARFVRDPFSDTPHARLYRTGDLASIRPDGELEYLGRADCQVKLRGFRIELGEIEAVLRSAPGIADVAVVLREDEPDMPALVAYIVPDSSCLPDPQELRVRMARELPQHMCPASFVLLNELPLTAHGKLDRKALAAPQPGAMASFAVSPGEDAAAHLAGLYKEILGVSVAGSDSHFFELGGTSLQAMVLAIRIAERFGAVLPAGAVFRHPRIGELAAEVARSIEAGKPEAGPDDSSSTTNLGDWLPLSHAQEQIWLVNMLSPGSAAFHSPAAFRIHGCLDALRLANALEKACYRHPSLRTTFHGDRPAQKIENAPTFRLEFEDLRGTSVDSMERLRNSVMRPLDLSRTAGWAALWRTADEEHLFVIVLHHLITDGWSMARLLDEIAADYGGRPVPEPGGRFVDLADEHRRRLAAGGFEESARYWKAEFEGAPTVTGIPTEYPRPVNVVFRSDRLSFSVSASLAAGLASLARAECCTANTLLLSALAILLYRHSSQTDLVLGVPCAGRDRVESARVQGLFMSLTPVRFQLTGDMSFRRVASETQARITNALTHSGFPFARIVQELRIGREVNRQPFVQILYAPQTADNGVLALGTAAAERIPVDCGSTHYDLTLCAWPEGASFAFELVYASDLFSAAAMEDFRDRFLQLLSSCVAAPGTPIAELDILPPVERERLLLEWSGRNELDSRANQPLRSFLEVFAQVVAAGRNSEAIRYGEQCVTYGELDVWSNRIAHALVARGAKRESLVAISCERSPAAMAAVLGVWKAGAAYVPLDPFYPPDRLAWMLRDSGARLLLTTPQARTSVEGQAERILLDDSILQYPAGLDTAFPDLGSLAYVIYTSGSTGTPKGVMVEHRGVAALTGAILDRSPLPRDARVLQYTSLSFDVCVGEIVAAFAQGATLVIPVQPHMLAGTELLDLLETERISQALLPMPVLAQLEPRSLPCLIRLISGGERCPAALVGRWSSGRCFINAYGPTEATVGASAHQCQPGEGDPPIGRPLPGWTLYVLDETGRIVPPLAPGELYIGGNGLARGYFGRPDLTRERFVEGLSGLPERLYRTGDLVRWQRDGALEFIGRRDRQHKVRGFRIELDEIEAVLLTHPDVRSAAAIVDGEGPRARVMAYVVAEPDRVPEIMAQLRSSLPPHMVPSEIVALDALPLTPNGKLDRNALTEVAARPVASTLPSEGARAMSAIWRQVLQRDVPGTVNFFDVGGTSLALVEIQAAIEASNGVRIPLAELFAHPTIEAMSKLVAQLAGGSEPRGSQPSRKPTGLSPRFAEGLAIVGMAARFPKAPDIATFWRNLCEGVECITRFTVEESIEAGVPAAMALDPRYVRARGVIDDDDKFDAALFEIGAHEAERIDPQQRLWLECALAAIEDAGCDPRRFAGSIGVFAGMGASEYMLRWAAQDMGQASSDYQLGLGNDKDFAATRVSYKLGLRGPGVTVQTACSTSLVAVYIACQQLLAGDCDMAIAGAASLAVPSRTGYLYQNGMILSSDGHCRPFDRAAGGTVPADGAGAVVLKRLSDAVRDGDDIYAVIAGGAINNDGAAKVGYTAPGIPGQLEVIGRALERAGLSARDVSYIETHGTGTAMGDPIEFSALTQVFERAGAAPGQCALGAVKSNLGHLNTAAGIAGLIKMALSLRHQVIPGTLHFESPNPEIALEGSPFFIPTTLRQWVPPKGRPRVGGVSSFGVGGTNAHLVVTEASRRSAQPATLAAEILPISAASPNALDAIGQNLAGWLESGQRSLASAARTLQMGRISRKERRAVVAADPAEAARKLRATAGGDAAPGSRRPMDLAFLFPGQGSQAPFMCVALAGSEPRVREELERLDTVFRSAAGVRLMDILRNPVGIHETVNAQPALFAIEYALAKVLGEWGLQPHAMLGHSLGEYVAACLAGVFPLEAAVALVAARGRLMQDTEPGAMISVPLSEADTLPFLGHDLDLAAINAPAQCVASGSEPAAVTLLQRLQARGLEGRRLRSTRAFHSRLMDPVLEGFRRECARVRFASPQSPFLSCLTGDWIRPSQAVDPEYWVQQLRRPARFHDALTRLMDRSTVLVEVGPGKVLASLARRHPSRPEDLTVLTTLGRPDDTESEQARWLGAIADAWCAGASVRWDVIRDWQGVNLAHLPTYPFERRRYWGLGPAASPIEKPVADDPSGWLYVPRWRPAPPPSPGKAPGRWLVLSGRNGFGAKLAGVLGTDTVFAHPGEAFARTGEREFTVRPSSRDDIEALLEAVDGDQPLGIVHMFSLDSARLLPDIANALAHSYFSVVATVQAVAGSTIPKAQLSVFTAGGQAAGGPPANPLQAMVAGLMRVVPVEYTSLQSRHIDVDADSLARPELIETVVQELRGWIEAGTPWPAGTSSVALRGRERLTFSLEPASPESHAVPSGAGAMPVLKHKGVYLITGGLGGVGLALAEHLASNYRARLVLASRRPLAPEEDWPRIGREDAEAGLRFEAFRRTRQAADRLVVTSADVGDPEQARALVNLAMAEFGSLDGVIHTAGITSGGALALRGDETPREVFRAKVHGTLNLEAALSEVPHSFLFLCSSLTAIGGVFGQADYTAANAFLDAFAENRNSPSRRVVSVNWDGWRDVGAYARHRQAALQGQRHSRYPLLDAWEHETRGSAYRTDLDVGRWIVSEHRVDGQMMLPGAAFLEIACEAALSRGWELPFAVHELTLVSPCVVPDRGCRSLYTFIGGNGQELELRMESRDTSGHWCLHALARIGTADASVEELDQELVALGRQNQALPLRPGGGLIVFGPRWQGTGWRQRAGNRCIGGFRLPDAFVKETAGHILHPALFDLLSSVAECDAGVSYLPFSYANVKLLRPMGSDVLVSAEQSKRGSMAHLGLRIYDREGKPLAIVDDYTLREMVAPVEAR